MNTLVRKTHAHPFNLEKIREIFVMSSTIADDAESVLEDSMAFSSKFLHGLNSSLEDARKGKVRKINSLRDVLHQ